MKSKPHQTREWRLRKIKEKNPSSRVIFGEEVEMDSEPKSIPIISIPDNIKQTGTCPLDLTAIALKHLHQSGIVVLENAVGNTSLDRLNAVLAPDAVRLAEITGQ